MSINNFIQVAIEGGELVAHGKTTGPSGKPLNLPAHPDAGQALEIFVSVISVEFPKTKRCDLHVDRPQDNPWTARIGAAHHDFKNKEPVYAVGFAALPGDAHFLWGEQFVIGDPPHE